MSSVTEGAVTTAQALADRGQFDAAIAYASAANRRDCNPTLQRNLALWRHLVFASIERSRQRADWPPFAPDPFPRCETLPELPFERLDVAHLAGSIAHHGCLVVRSLLSEREAGELVEGINAAMAASERADATGQGGDGSWYSPFPMPSDCELGLIRPWLRSLGGLLLADSPRMLFEVLELFGRKRLDGLVGEYLGERPTISVGKTTLRRISPSGAVDWHQDGAFLGHNTRTVNLWIALSDCGVDAPGLDIVSRRLTGIVETGTRGADFDWSVGQEMAVATAESRPIITPHFRAGDAILFDHLLLHRTGMGPSMTRQRWALETWFFAPSSYPMAQVPLVI